MGITEEDVISKREFVQAKMGLGEDEISFEELLMEV